MLHLRKPSAALPVSPSALVLLAAFLLLSRGLTLPAALLSAALRHERPHVLTLHALHTPPRRLTLSATGAALYVPDLPRLSYGGELLAVAAGPGCNLLLWALLSLPAPEEQIQFAGEIMEKGYSVRETEERIRQRLQAQDQPAQARPAPSPLRLYYKEAERQLTAGLGRRVTITQGKKKGKIALEYYDQEDLEGLMQALSALDTGKERRKP